MEVMLNNSDFSETSSDPESLDQILQEREKHTKVLTVAPVANICQLQEHFQSALDISEKEENRTHSGIKRMKIQDKETYQPKRFASTDMKAHSSNKRILISRNGVGNRHGMKYTKFKKMFSKVLTHKVTYSGVTIKIKEYLPTNDCNPATVKTNENMKLKRIFKTLCSQIMNYNKDVIYTFTIIDIMSASYRKCQSSVTFFDENNSVGPLQLKSHIQDFREDKIDIWNTKKNVISKNFQFLYNQPPYFATLKHPVPKLGNVFPSVISYLYSNHTEVMDIERKMIECLSIEKESENYELKKLHSRNDTFSKGKSYNYEVFALGCLELDFYVYNDRKFNKKRCSNAKSIPSKSDGNILDKGFGPKQNCKIEEAQNDKEFLGNKSSKEILLLSKNGDDILEKYHRHEYSKLHTNEYSNVIVNDDKIPTEVSDFVLDFDREKNNPEKRLNENYEIKSKNAKDSLDNKSNSEIKNPEIKLYEKDEMKSKNDKDSLDNKSNNEIKNPETKLNENDERRSKSDEDSLDNESNNEINNPETKLNKNNEMKIKNDKDSLNNKSNNETNNPETKLNENNEIKSNNDKDSFDNKSNDEIKNLETKLNENDEMKVKNDKYLLDNKRNNGIKNPEAKLNENDEMKRENDKDSLDNKSNNAEKYNKHAHSKLHTDEYSNIIDNEYEIPMEVSELIFWDLDSEKNVSGLKLDETEYSSGIEWINDISGHRNCVQLFGVFEKHSELVLYSTELLTRKESLQDQNGDPIYEVDLSFNEERRKSNSRITTRNIEYESAVPTDSHYHCFSMETNKHVQNGVYDPITESWREEIFKENNFDENCNKRNFNFEGINMQSRRITKNYYVGRKLAKVVYKLLGKMKTDYGDVDKEKASKMERSKLALTLEMLGLLSASQFVNDLEQGVALRHLKINAKYAKFI